MKEQPMVTVIVPAYNSAITIACCLESVCAQNYPKERFTVVVVDHASSDGTGAIARSYADRVHPKIGGTISAVRNLGALQADGEIYAFVDSDCIVDPDWLAAAVEVLRDPSVGATGSGYLTPETFTWVEKAWLYELKRAPFKTGFLPGGNLIVRGEVFKAIGGFDESLITGEDADICSRINRSGHPVINDCRIRCVHLGNAKTLKVFFRKERWYGANMIEGLSVKDYDATFVATLVFCAGNVSTLLGLLLYLYSGDPRLFGLSVSAVFLVLAASSLHRVMRSRKYSYFPHLVVLYFVYFWARTCAMVKALTQNSAKLQKAADPAR